jgi:hypothetical protein
MQGTGAFGLDQAFMIDWAEANYRKIIQAEDERERSTAWPGGLFDPYDPDAGQIDYEIATQEYIGEDGRKYQSIDAARTAQLRQERQAKEEAKRLEQERRERERAELEELPGFGSF